MIRIQLPLEQRQSLEQARRVRTSNLSERCLAVLLSDRGQSVPVIAESIGRHEHTIRSWLKAYLSDGIEGLKNTPPPGRRNRKEHEALMLLQPVLGKHPSDYGYLEAGWSTHLLVDYLSGQGLEISESTVKRALKRDGWVYKRFAKTVPMDAPNSQEKKLGWTRLSPPSSRSRTSRCCSLMNPTLATSPMCNGVGSERKPSAKSISPKGGKARRSLAL